MYKNYIKRIFDLIFALILMPFFLVLYLLVGILIKIEDKGPIFYNGERLGYKGKTFKMHKFRSMKVNAPDWRLEDGSTFNAEDDPRQTKVGKVLRKTSIDEIPQIVNILKGEMSFIGPRPDLPEAIKFYNEHEIMKLQVRPGITGYSQAYYRNSIDQRDKFKNDIYYVKNVSIIQDIKILYMTVINVVLRKNIHSNKETLKS